MTKDTGDSAFPQIESDYNEYDNKYENVHSIGGMTLRDYFAAKAMQGLIARQTPEDNEIPKWLTFVSEAAYDYADAMIAERNN